MYELERDRMISGGCTYPKKREMNYTLDTAAIRRRFEQAIIGIRADGTMAVLVPCANSYDNMFVDIVAGFGFYYTDDLPISFPTLIRPGDECEVRLRPSLEWKQAKYFGFNAGYFSYFMATIKDGVAAWEFIRPLPKEHLANRCTCVQYTNGRPSHVLDPSCPIHGNNSPLPAAETNPLLTRLTAAEQELAAIRAEMEQAQK